MKKFITSMAVATLLVCILPACKKTDTPAPQTTEQKLQAKWQLDTYAENDHFSGADHLQNLTGGPNDYLDFRSDGKVYVSLFGIKDTSVYALSGDTKIVIDGAVIYDIKALTGSSFIMYQKDVSGSDFFEQTFKMKK
ncbi:MAG TPA: hypothetical protein VMY77_08670 [Chitinophagaceae bacterium]|nr:hypothetical protein [Chitinophagaceae bacterium]